MYKAIFYKEWLKIRWIYFAMSAVSLLILGYILLNISHDLKFIKAPSYLYQVIFMGAKFYSIYMYIPLLTGLVIAISQFVPEVHSSRLKLTLHLPENENKILIEMISVGFLFLILLFLFSIIVLAIIVRIYFPTEIVNSVLYTSSPWFIAGIAVYFAVSMIIIEPIWSRRILYFLITYGFTNTLFKSYWYNLYDRSLPLYILFTLFFSISILLSGYRFKKGVMR